MEFDRIKDIIVDTLGLEEEQIKPEASLRNDLQVDSLDAMEVILALEEEYDITIPSEKLEDFACIGDIVKYIEENK